MIQHIKQNDKGCLPIVQSSGCRFRCDGLAAEYKTGKSLAAWQLNDTWKWAQSTGNIGNIQPVDCGVKLYEAFSPKCSTKNTKCPYWDSCKFNCEIHGDAIATHFLHLLGDDGRFVEAGILRNGVMTWYPSIPLKWRRKDACIQKILQGGPQGTHFRLVDSEGTCIEDPHSPAIASLQTVYTVFYVYIPA